MASDGWETPVSCVLLPGRAVRPFHFFLLLMFFGFKASALAGVLLLVTAFARAQAPSLLPAHAVRSINPTDTDFRDLEFLQAEIGPARVVMLGEPSHGEGNVFEAKIRLLRFLREQMGFTTVAFESGFYDLHKAQQALEAVTVLVLVAGSTFSAVSLVVWY